MGEGTLQTGRVGRQVRQGQFNPIGTLQTGRVKSGSVVASAPQFAGVDSWDLSGKSVESETDGTAIENWVDRHAGLTLTQSTASRRLTKRTVGGLPCLEGDGIDDQMVAAWAPDLTSGHTIFVVQQTIDAVGFDGWVLADLGNASDPTDSAVEVYFAGSTNPAPIVSTARRNAGVQFYQTPSVFVDGTPQMVTTLHGTDTAVRGLYDGRTREDAAPNTGTGIVLNNPTRLLVGCGYDENSVEGYIFEIVIYAAALTESQRDEVWDWLESEWGGPF